MGVQRSIETPLRDCNDPEVDGIGCRLTGPHHGYGKAAAQGGREDRKEP